MPKTPGRSIALGGLLCLAAASAWLHVVHTPTQAQGNDSRYFPETKHTVSGIFWKYWLEHGGLAQQGYPISEEFTKDGI